MAPPRFDSGFGHMDERTEGGVRPDVALFGLEMEREMAAKDGEYGDSWKECHISYLLKGLKTKVEELEEALVNREDVLTEAADVANFAMMIAARVSAEEAA